MPKTLECIPSVLQLMIFSFLKPKELAATVTRVSKSFWKEADSSKCWDQQLKAVTSYTDKSKSSKQVYKLICELGQLSQRQLLFATKLDPEIETLVNKTPYLNQKYSKSMNVTFLGQSQNVRIIRNYNQMGDLIREEFTHDQPRLIVYDRNGSRYEQISNPQFDLEQKMVNMQEEEVILHENNLQESKLPIPNNTIKKLIEDKLNIIASFLAAIFNIGDWKIDYQAVSLSCQGRDLRLGEGAQKLDPVTMTELRLMLERSFFRIVHYNEFTKLETEEEEYRIDDLDFLIKMVAIAERYFVSSLYQESTTPLKNLL